MTVTPEKMAVVVFKSPRASVQPFTWTCGGKPLPQQDGYKYLGLPFTSTHGVAGLCLNCSGGGTPRTACCGRDTEGYSSLCHHTHAGAASNYSAANGLLCQ